MKTLLFASVILLLLKQPLTADPKPKQERAGRTEKSEERLVFVTGSLIPQRLKVHPVGTATVSPVRIIDRHEIDGTGRATTLGAFANEPSVSIVGH